jgi:hypothetical protein
MKENMSQKLAPLLAYIRAQNSYKKERKRITSCLKNYIQYVYIHMNMYITVYIICIFVYVSICTHNIVCIHIYSQTIIFSFFQTWGWNPGP